MQALHQPEPVRHHARGQLDATPRERCCATANKTTPAGETPYCGVVEPVGAFLDVGVFCEPVVRGSNVRGDLAKVFLGHVAHHCEQRCRQFVASDEIIIVTVVLVAIRLDGTHPLDPTANTRRTLLNEHRRRRVTEEMRPHGRDQSVVTNGRTIAEQVRVVDQVGLEQVEPLMEGRLDQRLRFGRDAKNHRRLTHPSTAVQEHLLGLFGGQGLRKAERELRGDERQILLIEVPAIVHCRAQQALAAEQLEQMRDRQQQRRIWIRGRPAQRLPWAPFEVVDDVGAVLNDRAVGRLHAWDDPAADDRHDVVQVPIATRRLLDERDALGSQIGPGLAGVQRRRHSIQGVLSVHRQALSSWEMGRGP